MISAEIILLEHIELYLRVRWIEMYLMYMKLREKQCNTPAGPEQIYGSFDIIAFFKNLL